MKKQHCNNDIIISTFVKQCWCHFLHDNITSFCTTFVQQHLHLVIYVLLQLCFNFLFIRLFVHLFASRLVYSCVLCLIFLLVHLCLIFLLIYVLVAFDNLCILHCDIIVFICKFRSSLFFIFYYFLCCMFLMFLFVDLCAFNIDEVFYCRISTIHIQY
jgi:hypothetical protein